MGIQSKNYYRNSFFFAALDNGVTWINTNENQSDGVIRSHYCELIALYFLELNYYVSQVKPVVILTGLACYRLVLGFLMLVLSTWTMVSWRSTSNIVCC